MMKPASAKALTFLAAVLLIAGGIVMSPSGILFYQRRPR
jgi:hypothetical protein